MTEQNRDNSIIPQEINQKSEEIIKLETRISDLERENAELKEKAFKDSLTGIYNRSFAQEELERQFLPSKPRQDLSIAFVDIDGFKIINDLKSHEDGDGFLKLVAKSLQESSRETDIVSRWAGDEFMVILPNCGEEQKEMMVSRIKKAGQDNLVRLSVGFATIKANEDNPYKNVNEFVTAAESKMKLDKSPEDSRQKLSQ